MWTEVVKAFLHPHSYSPYLGIFISQPQTDLSAGRSLLTQDF